METLLALLFQEHRLSSALPHIFTALVMKRPQYLGQYLSCALNCIVKENTFN